MNATMSAGRLTRASPESKTKPRYTRSRLNLRLENVWTAVGKAVLGLAVRIAPDPLRPARPR